MAGQRVGIVTLYYNNENMGGLLQAYALQKSIETLGMEAKQIKYDYNYLSRSQKKIHSRHLLEQALYSGPEETIKKLYKRFLGGRINNVTKDVEYQKQLDAYHAFAEKIPHTEKVYNSDTIEETNCLFDAFVCGSDVVWHPSRMMHPAYYLRFASSEKVKIPYAVSMGRLPYTPLEKNMLKKNLQGYSLIATREQSAATYITQLTGIQTITVVDPTLLLTGGDWEKIENKRCLKNVTGKYIFCYLFNEDKWCREYISMYAKKIGASVVYFPFILGDKRNVDRILKGIEIYDAGPEEFLSLIHNAECVFTDSFHAVVFSTLFKKEFYVFSRDSNTAKTSINSRVDEFLKHYGLSERYISKETKELHESKVDKHYPKITGIIDRERKKAYDYLLNNLEKD